MVLNELGELATSATVETKVLQTSPGRAAVVTTLRVVLCSFLSVLAGLLLGLLLGLSHVGSHLASPSIEFTRTLPVTFLLPFVTYSVGIGGPSVPWLLASIPCTLIVAITVSRGLRQVDKERQACIEAFFGAVNRRRLIRHLYLPVTSSSLATGTRLAVPYAVILIGVLEYVGVGGEARGLGYVIGMCDGMGEAQQFAAVIAYGLFGLALVGLLTFIESRIQPWRPPQ
jgi:ABC-type nitrate/sulfonate/bicarbonate transport system permease component